MKDDMKTETILFTLMTLVGIIVIIVFFVLPIYTSKRSCSSPITEENVHFFTSGRLGSMETWSTLQRVNNPKDWDFNEYFTGTGWSNNKDDVMKVPEADTCRIKEKYFSIR